MIVSKSLRVTVLADDAASPPLVAEHGFSALVEAVSPDGKTRTVLLDTGRGAIFENAASLGVDLSTVELVALSHGHYDHTDALSEFLSRYPHAASRASRAFFRPHFSDRGGKSRDIALSAQNRAFLSDAPRDRFSAVDDASETLEGLFTLAGSIPRCSPLETPSPRLYADAKLSEPDEVPDEIFLMAETREGLVILTGCCHAGFINTCERARSLSGGKPIRAVVGGLHLAGAPFARISATAEYIRCLGIPLVVPCHCTGDAEIAALARFLGPAIEKGSCGTIIAL